MGTVYLGGGGSDDDEAALWDQLFVSGQRVTVWPFAQPDRRAREVSVGWLSSKLTGRGDFTIDAWLDEDSDLAVRQGRLDLSQVLVLPGGNTFHLLRYLQRYDLFDVITDFLAAGGRVYGGSAGAIVLGADVAIAASVDRDAPGGGTTQGLDLLVGAVVHPHYGDGQADEVQRWAREHGRPVLALPERSGLVVEQGNARNVGPEAVHLVSGTGVHTHPAGAMWRLSAGTGS